MADGARALTNACEEVFGPETVRLMCWAHCYRNYSKKIKKIKNKQVGNRLNYDIKQLQWMLQSQEEYRVVLGLLELQYLEDHHADEEDLIQFFNYFREQVLFSLIFFTLLDQ